MTNCKCICISGESRLDANDSDGQQLKQVVVACREIKKCAFVQPPAGCWRSTKRITVNRKPDLHCKILADWMQDNRHSNDC